MQLLLNTEMLLMYSVNHHYTFIQTSLRWVDQANLFSAEFV